jgi:putative membrane protein
MVSEKKVFGLIGIISASVIGFLFWIIYFKTGSDENAIGWIRNLPALNAFLNALTATLLVFGFVFIKRNRIDLHKRAMLLATFTSACFLISYITYHHFQGDTKFLGEGVIRPIYFSILISHILLSIIQVPLILITLYLAAIQNYKRHRLFARITFPIWLYVSVTGVFIFIILRFFNQGA